MFEHDLDAAATDFLLGGSESPTLRIRIRRLHAIHTIAQSTKPALPTPDELASIGAFLEKVRPYGLLDGLLNAYPGQTLSDFLPSNSSPPPGIEKPATQSRPARPDLPIPGRLPKQINPPRKTPEAYEHAILEGSRFLELALKYANNSRLESLGSQMGSILAQAEYHFPSLLRIPKIIEARKLLNSLRKAGLVKNQNCFISAGAPGLGKRR